MRGGQKKLEVQRVKQHARREREAIEKLKEDSSLVDLQFHHLPLQERAKKRKAFVNAIEKKQHEISKLSVTPFERFEHSKFSTR